MSMFIKIFTKVNFVKNIRFKIPNDIKKMKASKLEPTFLSNKK